MKKSQFFERTDKIALFLLVVCLGFRDIYPSIGKIEFADFFGAIGSLLSGMYETKIDGYMSRGVDMSFNSRQTAA